MNNNEQTSLTLPSPRHLLWHQTGFYALIHFSINTFTDKEWGYGDEPAETFNPSDFNVDQIVGTGRDAGMKGLVLVCKHHDGFCLWPTHTTEHCIRNSPWKDGQGDMVREFANSCRKHGLKFGTYLSPWDRNHPAYGTPEYLRVYQTQLEELMTGYGPLFEVWFDGANGGDGYYGGARETRSIDRSTYYDWENTWNIVRRFQPDACMFSDAGPDLRWVGNEHGLANETCWAAYTPHPAPDCTVATPGATVYQEGGSGHFDGMYWMPAECDVPLRPGWFYHAHEDDKVKSLREMVDIYLASYGRGGSLSLGLAPDRRGRLHENDVTVLKEFGRIMRTMFKTDLLESGAVLTSDANEMVMALSRLSEFNLLMIQEDIENGQRIRQFAVDVRVNGEWQEVYRGESIGAQRLISFEAVKSDMVRLRILDACGTPSIRSVGAFKMPQIDTKSNIVDAGLSQQTWRIMTGKDNAEALLNVDPSQIWRVQGVPPYEVTIDLRDVYHLQGFSMMPDDKTLAGRPERYAFYTSIDGANWGEPAAAGEFANIKANPVRQYVKFNEARDGRFIRLVVTATLGGNDCLRMVNLNVIV